MRRTKQQEEQPESAAAPSNVAKAPTLTPATLPRVKPQAPQEAEDQGGDDLERGRTIAMVAALGRVTLTLDLIERRLGRMEDAILEVAATHAEMRDRGLIPAGLAYVDAPIGDAGLTQDASDSGISPGGKSDALEEAETTS